jgi:hypothetical protein
MPEEVMRGRQIIHRVLVLVDKCPAGKDAHLCWMFSEVINCHPDDEYFATGINIKEWIQASLGKFSTYQAWIAVNYPHLENTADNRNAGRIAWLKWMLDSTSNGEVFWEVKPYRHGTQHRSSGRIKVYDRH